MRFNGAVDSLLDTVGGLPVHPLVVHFAVVLLPLASFSVIVAVYIPRFRKKYAFASMVGVFLGVGAAFVAKQSGEALAARVGNPKTHSNYGDILPILASLFFLAAILWYRSIRNSQSVKPNILGHVTSILGVSVLILTFLTGHTGAEAVWQVKLSATTSGQVDKANADSSKKSYSTKDVAQHSTSQSCWSIVNGNVYDLTTWIGKHPGGPAFIEAICGKDGTAAFNGQHMGQQRPESILASYQIGVLI
ncbi:MAG: hypothetical protein RLZZ251_266 [Actinomycetota bacterium]